MGRKNKVLKQQEQIRRLEQQLAQAAAPPPPAATFRPLLSRPSYDEWDWTCGACGYLVHVGRQVCPQSRCNGTRRQGITCVGSFRGKFEAGARTARHISQQLAAAALPSELPSRRVLQQQQSTLPIGRVQQPVQVLRPSAQPAPRRDGANGRPGNAASAQPLGVGAGGHAAPTRATAGSTNPAADAGGQSRGAKISTSPKSWLEAAAGANTPAGSNVAVGPFPAANGMASSRGSDDIAMSPAQRFAEDDVDPADDFETVPEEIDDQRTSKELAARIIKIGKIVSQRRRQHEKAEAAVAEQIEEIALQQATLVDLQAQADYRLEQIQALQLEEGVISQRLAKINPVQGDATPMDTDAGAPVLTPVQTAMECISKTFLGLQHFQDQCPEIRAILSVFAQEVEKLQAAEFASRAPGQPTIQQTFAAQKAATSETTGHTAEASASEYGPCLAAAVQKRRTDRNNLIPTVEVTGPQMPLEPRQPPVAQQPPTALQPASPRVEQFDISSSSGSGSATSTPAEVVQPAAVSGYGKVSRMRQPLCNKCRAVCCKCTAHPQGHADAARSDADAAMVAETAMVVWQPNKNRTQFLRQLATENERQAELAGKRAADEPSMRSSPYGR